MTSLFSALALTLYPDMFPGPLGQSLAGKALEKGIWSLQTLQIRDFATDKHKTVDDSPYGGGAGMVFKPDVVDAAVTRAKTLLPGARVIYTSPRGVPMTQKLVQQLISSPSRGEVGRGAQHGESSQMRPHPNPPPTGEGTKLIILCGRFEGVDERVIAHHDMLEVSLGDFVLSGGEIAALALLDACVRLLPGVMGNPETAGQESFAQTSEYAGLLEYPHYTRPPIWKGKEVPEVLLSGNHKHIHAWRLEQAKLVTLARRPDLITKKD